jgi:hypothetical protein
MHALAYAEFRSNKMAAESILNGAPKLFLICRQFAVEKEKCISDMDKLDITQVNCGIST